MKKYFLGLAILVTVLLGANQIYAETPAAENKLINAKEVAPEKMKAFKGKLTLEQKKEKYAAKQSEWAKLSKEQKLKTLNDRQAKKIKSMQDRWAKLNDDQKIARYESGMKRGQEMSLKAAVYRQKCDDLMSKAAAN
jgi:hypothetical protein